MVLDHGQPPIRLDSDDVARTVTVYILAPTDGEPIARIVLGWQYARWAAHWILEMTRADNELNS